MGVFLRELTDAATAGRPVQAALWALAGGRRRWRPVSRWGGPSWP
ncbi:hypothetical protein [Nonomuraea rubra]